MASAEFELPTLRRRVVYFHVARPVLTPVDAGGSIEPIRGFKDSLVSSQSESAKRLAQLAQI